MSLTKKIFLLILFVGFSGCSNSYRTLSLNKDGSGTYECRIDFERANEKQKARLKAFVKQKNTSSPFDTEKLLSSFPEPYFQIEKKEVDKEKLEMYIKIHFKDINRFLAVEEFHTSVVPKDFDFTVEPGGLRFLKILKAGESGPDLKSAVPYNHLTIKTETAAVVMEWEDKPQSEDLTLSKLLPLSGHSIERRTIKRNFLEYPVLLNTSVQVDELEWRCYKGKWKRESILELELAIELPQKELFTYIQWSEGIMMDGSYGDGTELKASKSFSKKSSDVKGRYGDKNSFALDLELLMPPKPVMEMKESTLRLHLTRASKTKRLKLGRVEEKASYTIKGLDIKIDDLENNTLSLKVEGDPRSIAGVVIQSKRGNFYILDKSSWSFQEKSGTLGFWEFIPLEGTTLYIDFFDPVEHVYMDIKLPEVDLSPRMSDTTEGVHQWKKSLKTEFKKLHSVNLEGIDEVDMTSDTALLEYVQKVKDEELPAVFVQLCLRLDEGENSGNRVHNVFSNILQKRKEYREKNWKLWLGLTQRLLTLIPDELEDSLVYLAGNLGIERATREEAVRYISEGRMGFVEKQFFPGKLRASEYALLLSEFNASKDWVKGKKLLTFMVEQGERVDVKMLRGILFSTNKDDMIRLAAMNPLAEKGSLFFMW